MEKSRILFVTQEITPFLSESNLAATVRKISQGVHEKDKEIRIFMPRFGVVNERRHQLHEVIRLSGLNLVIDDLDMPLIIKVASIPKERIQVYFIDNEEYFKRKSTFLDKEGKLFDDNDERAIFFAKGVLETIKRLNWSPDIIHIHGWMASLLPLYINEFYKEEPIFQKSKIITSLYKNEFEQTLSDKMMKKIMFDEIDKEKVEVLKKATYENLIKLAIDFSDGLIIGSENVSEGITSYLKKSKKPSLEYHPMDSFSDHYLEFYEKFLNN